MCASLDDAKKRCKIIPFRRIGKIFCRFFCPGVRFLARKREGIEALPRRYHVTEKLDRSDDHAALGILTLGVSHHSIVIDEREVDETTLIGVHGGKRDLAVTLLGACR